jgi:hypothetical protein
MTNFLTPVARLVSGSLFEPQTKDLNGDPLVIKRGPNVGQPMIRYFFALAIQKNDPGLNELMSVLQKTAVDAFPQLFDPQGACLAPDFAWKFKDGDSTVPDRKGNRPCDKEGYPGHYVFMFSGNYAPKVHAEDARTVLSDPNSVKRGYYIRVNGNAKGNGEKAKPGLYLNYTSIQFVAYGPVIETGPDTSAAFLAAPVAALPPGASRTPIAPVNAPAVPSQVAPGAPPVAAMQGAGVIPGAMQGAADTPPPWLSGAPAPAPTTVVVNGQTFEVEALRAAGWSDEQIKAYRNG